MALPPGHAADLVIEGTSGRMTVINPLAPHDGHEIVIESEGREDRETVAGESTYRHQLEHVIEVVRGKAEAITGGDYAVANMRAIDSIYRAAGLLPRGLAA